MENGNILKERISKIKLLILDIDGVLTNGEVFFDEKNSEISSINIHDAHGIKLLQRVGIEVILLSGRKSKLNVFRAKRLQVKKLYEDCKVKLPIVEEILREYNLKNEEIAYMGDDLIDLPPLRIAGLALAPLNAVREVKDVTDWISSKEGGKGAVRQACELILKNSNMWKRVFDRYL